MSISNYYDREAGSRSPDANDNDEIVWEAASPTESDSSDSSDPSSHHTSPAASSGANSRSSSSTTMHSAPGSPPSKYSGSLAPKSPHPYRSSAPAARPLRPRGLTPLSSNTTALPLGTGQLPKSQPLARALFQRMASDTPHAGFGGGKKKTADQKLIVPTKSFKTSFELDLTASELARR